METPTPKKRRRLLPILAGLVVACVVLVFIAALLSPTEQPAATVADQPPVEAPAATVADQPTATPQPVATDTPVLPTATPEPPTATPQPALAQIGNRVEAGGIALTVNSAQTIASFDFMTAADGKTYLVLDVLLETTDRDTAPYNPLYFSVKDSDGFEHANALLAPDPSLKSGELARGDRVRGNVAFEVPLGATGLVVTYEPLVIMGGYEPLRVAVDPAS